MRATWFFMLLALGALMGGCVALDVALLVNDFTHPELRQKCRYTMPGTSSAPKPIDMVCEPERTK